MPKDKKLYKALRKIMDYCDHVPCCGCKIKGIIGCDFNENSYNDEIMPAPMYWDSELLGMKLKQEERHE